MGVPLAVALLALLLALFCLVALVAVYARLRALEAGRAAELSGYASIVGRRAPPPVRPLPGQHRGLVAVLDADCALCHVVRDGLADTAARVPGLRAVALVPGGVEQAGPDGVATVADPAARAELYEGYAPTVLVVDGAGTVTDRRFVYADTDVRALLTDLTDGREVTRA